MIRDPDEHRPEHLDWDEAVTRYEAHPDFIAEALDTVIVADDLDDPQLAAVREALTAWYRKTHTYESCVRHIIEDAAHA